MLKSFARVVLFASSIKLAHKHSRVNFKVCDQLPSLLKVFQWTWSLLCLLLLRDLMQSSQLLTGSEIWWHLYQLLQLLMLLDLRSCSSNISFVNLVCLNKSSQTGILGLLLFSGRALLGCLDARWGWAVPIVHRQMGSQNNFTGQLSKLSDALLVLLRLTGTCI